LPQEPQSIEDSVIARCSPITNFELFNIADTPLTLLQKTVLGLGLKFLPLSSLSPEKCYSSVLASVKKSIRNIDLAMYFCRHSERSPFYQAIPRILSGSLWSPAAQPWSETIESVQTDIIRKLEPIRLCRPVSDPESLLIRSTLKSLGSRSDIVFKAADKNLGLCILTNSQYIDICMLHLNDSSVYSLVEIPDLTMFYENQFKTLSDILARFNVLRKKNDELTPLAASLLQLHRSDNLRIAPFYCLVKVHKPAPFPGRPIVSCLNTVPYFVSVFLDKLLQPLLRKLPTNCSSSHSVIKDLSLLNLQLPADSVLLTADVRSLYPSIPIPDGIQATRNTCIEFNYMLQHIDLIIELLSFVLKSNYCTFNNVFYLQTSGTAMGTPVAVCFACFFLYQIEKNIISDCIYYRRYIDDLFAIVKNRSCAVALIDAFNSPFPSIHLDSTVIGTTGIFLDLQFSIVENRIQHRLFQKPENKYSYIPTISDHNPSVFSNFILQELKRYRLSCTIPTDFDELISLFQLRLTRRGYSPFLFLSALARLPSREFLLQNLINSIPKEQRSQTKKPIVTLAIPRLLPRLPWREILSLPERLLAFAEYRAAYNELPAHITAGRKHCPNAARLLCHSLFQP
jgi:hypothetical protein